MEAPLRTRDHCAARIVRRPDPGDVASGPDHRRDCHRRQPVGTLENGRRRERSSARQRSDLRLRRRIGGELAHDEDLASGRLWPGTEGGESIARYRLQSIFCFR